VRHQACKLQGTISLPKWPQTLILCLLPGTHG